jgi:hypothetical protein
MMFCLKILVICKLWYSIWRFSSCVNCDVLLEDSRDIFIVIFYLKVFMICKLWFSIWRSSWFVNCDVLPELPISYTCNLYFCISLLHNDKLIVSKSKFVMCQCKYSSMLRCLNEDHVKILVVTEASIIIEVFWKYDNPYSGTLVYGD